MARMGNVYWKLENWAEALKWYEKSVAEHRNPDVVIKKNEVGSIAQVIFGKQLFYISW